jgi:spore germination protein YaaH
MPRRVAVYLVAVCAVACGSAAPTATATVSLRPTTGLLVVTTGGAALTDGANDVPPTLDLRVSASDPLAVQDVSAKLDGNGLDLRADTTGGLVAATKAMPLGSAHHLDLAVPGRDERTLAFHVVSPAQWMAALHADSTQAAVLDIAFDLAPDHQSVERAVPGGARTWVDDRHLEVTWPRAPGGSLSLAESIPAARGSHLSAGPVLDLRAVPVGSIRRVTAPGPPAPPTGPLVIAFSVGTSASRNSVAAHADQISVVSPTGLTAAADGSLDGAPDAPTVASALTHRLPVWPLVQNHGFDPAATSTLLHDATAVARLVEALRGVAGRAGFGGVQLDFEEVLTADKDALSALIGKLGAALHKDGHLLAVDVVPHKPGSLNVHSAAYDLQAIAAAADLVTLMAYEEHNPGTVPGPVAGLDWDRQLLAGSIPDLDSGRTLLGLPLYTRTWSTTGAPADAYAAAVGDALGAPGARVDYDFSGATPLIHAAAGAVTYFDDAQSLQAKMALVPEDKLTGIAVWRLGFEDPALWTLLPQSAPRI